MRMTQGSRTLMHSMYVHDLCVIQGRDDRVNKSYDSIGGSGAAEHPSPFSSHARDRSHPSNNHNNHSYSSDYGNNNLNTSISNGSYRDRENPSGPVNYHDHNNPGVDVHRHDSNWPSRRGTGVNSHADQHQAMSSNHCSKCEEKDQIINNLTKLYRNLIEQFEDATLTARGDLTVTLAGRPVVNDR